MYKIYFVIILCMCWGEDYNDNVEDIIWRRDEPVLPKTHLNLYKTFFPTLNNYEINAKYIQEKAYPWIAKVIHSRTQEVPHVCTAICIHAEVFITAYRCLARLKVAYTRIKYNGEFIGAKVFIFPTNTTKQAYDDIAFIVVKKTYKKAPYYKVLLYDYNRTDDTFQWYEKLDCNATHKAIGYAMLKLDHRFRTATTKFRLTELVVHIDMKLCQEIFTFNYLMGSFKVPCYHSCSLDEYRRNDPKCTNYHGVEGGAVYNTKTERLLGIATWGAYYSSYELPVGISIVNSDSFYKDFACARVIQNSYYYKPPPNLYQKLCDVAAKKTGRYGILT